MLQDHLVCGVNDQQIQCRLLRGRSDIYEGLRHSTGHGGGKTERTRAARDSKCERTLGVQQQERGSVKLKRVSVTTVE